MNVLPSMKQWYADQVVAPRAGAKRQRAKEAKSPKSYTVATDEDRRGLSALRGVTFCVGSPDKRFARQMANAEKLTAAQREYLWRIVWRFRRQIADKQIVAIAKVYGLASSASPAPVTEGGGT